MTRRMLKSVFFFVGSPSRDRRSGAALPDLRPMVAQPLDNTARVLDREGGP